MTTTPSLLTAEEVVAPAASGVPEEAARVLAQLARHQHVRGCIALTASDLRVIWSGGVVFASKEKLAQIVHFVRDTLNVTRRHVCVLEDNDQLGLMRIRTGAYELLITPSMCIFKSIMKNYAHNQAKHTYL